MAPGDPDGDFSHLPEVQLIRPEDDSQVQAEVRERRAAWVRRWRRRARKSAPFLILFLAWYLLMSATQRESVRAAAIADFIPSERSNVVDRVYYVAVEGGRDPSPELLAHLRAARTEFGVAAESEAPPRDEYDLIRGRDPNDDVIGIWIWVDGISLVMPFLATADVYMRQPPKSAAGYRMVVLWTGRWRVVSRQWTRVL